MSVIPRGFANMYQLLEVTPTVQFQPNNTRGLVEFDIVTPNFLRTQTGFFKITLQINWAAYYTNINGNGLQRCLVLDGLTTNFISRYEWIVRNKPVEEINYANYISQLVYDMQSTAAQAEGHEDFGLVYQSRTNASKDHFLGFDLQAPIYSNSTTIAVGQSTSYNTCLLPSYKKPDGMVVPTNGSIDIGVNFDTALDGMFSDQVSQMLPRGVDLTYPENTPPQSLGLGNLLGGTVLAANQVPRLVPFDMAYASFSQAVGCQGPYSDILNRSVGAQGACGFFGQTQIVTPYGTNQLVQRTGTGTVQLPAGEDLYPKCWQLGYQLPYCSELQSKSCNQVISPFPNIHISRGGILNQPTTRGQYVFRVPILSSFLGQASIGQPGQLLPGALLGPVRVRIELNPNAFYVSGLSSDQLIEQDPATLQFPKVWTFTDIRMVFDSYVFDIETRNLQPITFNTFAWTVPHTFQYPDTRSLQGERLVNYSYPNTLLQVVRINSDDGKIYNTCSQHFPICGNITSYQVRIGSTYIPAQPLVGHAGNPVEGMIDPYTGQVCVTQHNRQFVDQLARDLGTFFRIDLRDQISPVAFAINDRVYNPGNIGLPYAQTTYQNQNVSSNQDKLAAKTMYYETYKGSALYLTRFDNVNNPGVDMENSRMGIDTGLYRPFSIIISSDQVVYNPRPCTMFVYVYVGVTVTMSPNDGVQIAGLR